MKNKFTQVYTLSIDGEGVVAVFTTPQAAYDRIKFRINQRGYKIIQAFDEIEFECLNNWGCYIDAYDGQDNNTFTAGRIETFTLNTI